MEVKFSAGLWLFANPVDRFCPGGYSNPTSIQEQIDLAAKVSGLSAIECHQSDTEAISAEDLKRCLEDNGLVCSNVNLNVWGKQKWAKGAFSSPDEKIRTDAIDEGKKAVNLARKLGSRNIGLWLGSDGFDYPFQVNFKHQWDNLIDSIKEVAEYAAPDVKVGLEYKLKEPRTHIALSSAGKAISICLELGFDNLGVTLDFGHALLSRENPGNSAVYLSHYGKLFNVHLNDCYGEWDDDMIPGVVHFWETLEFFYYLQKIKYNGWLGLDMFPFREDSIKAAEMAIKNTKALITLIDEIDLSALLREQKKMDSVTTQEIIRKAVFKRIEKC